MLKFKDKKRNEVQIAVPLPDGIDLFAFCGVADSNLRALEELFDATLTIHDGQVIAHGDESDAPLFNSVVAELAESVMSGRVLNIEDVKSHYEIVKNSSYSPRSLHDDVILTYRGKTIRPKTSGQKLYCDAIRNNTVTFGIGPAGTGKSYLAMAMAVAALQRKEIGRIILTRPVVEAGENLGFLPGSLNEKVDPYIRPLYDALFDMTDAEKGAQLLEQGVVEIAPLAFMRGRTFNDAYLILDEAQNTTAEQLKMFLTRLGFGSKMIITGDVTQTDLPHGVSGLAGVETILGGLDDIEFVSFGQDDVVRHNLVARIVRAYEDHASADQ